MDLFSPKTLPLHSAYETAKRTISHCSEESPPKAEAMEEVRETVTKNRVVKETKDVSSVRLIPEKEQRRARRQLVFASSSEEANYESELDSPRVLVSRTKSSSKQIGVRYSPRQKVKEKLRSSLRQAFANEV